MTLKFDSGFYSTKTEEQRENDNRVTFTISMNSEEQEKLEEVMNILQEEQKGKALKQCFNIGYDVLHEPKIQAIRDSLFKNIVNNGRKGILIVEGKIKRM